MPSQVLHVISQRLFIVVMQFDMFHTHTVDAHTMQVITVADFFAHGTETFPVTTRIAQRLRNPSLLFLAALFHDIAGGEVSTTGARRG